MLAWSRREKDKYQAAIQAQRILDDLERLHSLGETDVAANVVCYTICMKAWADCAASAPPSNGDYNGSTAATAAEKLLRRMEHIYETTGDVRMKPTATSYTTVVAAHGRSKGKNSARNAERVVKHMEKFYLQDPDHRAKPNRIVYNALIDAWSKSNEVGAALRAEQTLMKMEKYNDVRPDVVSYNAVLNAWARFANGVDGSNAKDRIAAAQRAQQILEHMEGLGSIKDKEDNEGDDDNDEVVKPDAISYNTVLKAWARSGHPSAAFFAQQILQRMEELYSQTGDESIRPNVFSYTTTINAAAYAGGTIDERQKTYQIALDAFQKICESNYDRPSHVTYGTMFRAVANLSSFLDIETIKTIWHRCREEGQVSDFVLSQLRSATTPDLFSKLMSDRSKDSFSFTNSTNSIGDQGRRLIPAAELPLEWRENVQGKRQRY